MIGFQGQDNEFNIFRNILNNQDIQKTICNPITIPCLAL